VADTYETLTDRADAAAAAAARATLENVRERELRSEKVWRVLAEQTRARFEQREIQERESAARRAAESA
jgi:hypothetical protein